MSTWFMNVPQKQPLIKSSKKYFQRKYEGKIQRLPKLWRKNTDQWLNITVYPSRMSILRPLRPKTTAKQQGKMPAMSYWPPLFYKVSQTDSSFDSFFSTFVYILKIHSQFYSADFENFSKSAVLLTSISAIVLIFSVIS